MGGFDNPKFMAGLETGLDWIWKDLQSTMGGQSGNGDRKVNLNAGRFFIKIKYAGREGYVSTSQFSISWNGVKIRTIKAQDEEIHREKIYVNAFSGENTLQIAGEGPSDGYGMTIS